MGLWNIGWGFEKLSEVAMGLVKSQWGCLKSQRGSLLMGLFQGIAYRNETCLFLGNLHEMRHFELYHYLLFISVAIAAHCSRGTTGIKSEISSYLSHFSINGTRINIGV